MSLELPVIQAPISGYSDFAMREIARHHGAQATFSGLMLDRSVIHPKAWKQPLFSHHPHESPLGGQLVGADPDTMVRAAVVLQDHGYDLVDVNLACPAPKVLARGRGGALLRQPDLAIEIVRRLRHAVSVPLTVKLRTGHDQDQESRDAFWRICQGVLDAGADALIVHGRCVVQRYAGQADWDIVYEVKERFPHVTVLGSGDLFTAHAALDRLRNGPLDGLVLARGAIGNPWIFREVRALLAGDPLPIPPTVQEVGRVLEQHFDLVLNLYDVKKAIGHFRKFCVGYCRRHPQRKSALLDLMAADTVPAVRGAITQWFHQYAGSETTWPVPGRAGK